MPLSLGTSPTAVGYDIYQVLLETLMRQLENLEIMQETLVVQLEALVTRALEIPQQRILMEVGLGAPENLLKEGVCICVARAPSLARLGFKP